MNSFRYAALVGLGKLTSNSSDQESDTSLQLGKAIAAITKETKSREITIVVPNAIASSPEITNGNGNDTVSQFLYDNIIGLYEGIYHDVRYKGVLYNSEVNGSNHETSSLGDTIPGSEPTLHKYLKKVHYVGSPLLSLRNEDFGKVVREAKQLITGIEITKDLVGR